MFDEAELIQLRCEKEECNHITWISVGELLSAKNEWRCENCGTINTHEV